MNKLIILTIVSGLLYLSMATVQACSMTASGRCGGSACPSDQSCKKTGDFECSCVSKSASMLSEALDKQPVVPEASQSAEELFLNNPGRPGFKRLLIDAKGFGNVTCGKCSTGAGCTAFWVAFGTNVNCQATAANGHRFNFWTINGNFGGQRPSRRFNGKPGSLLVGNFSPNNELSSTSAEAQKNWSLDRPDDISTVAGGKPFEAVVENHAGSVSPVNVLINGGVAEQVAAGNSSRTLFVPLGDNDIARLDVKLITDGVAASGATHHFPRQNAPHDDPGAARQQATLLSERSTLADILNSGRDDEFTKCNTTYHVQGTDPHTDCESCLELVPEPGCPNKCPIWRIFDTNCRHYPDGSVYCETVGQCRFELQAE